MNRSHHAPSGCRAAGLAPPLLVLLVLVASLLALPAQASDQPRCDNCQPVQDSLYECLHYAGDPNGTPCSTTACIENTLDSASCQFHAANTGTANCNTDTTTGPEIVQVVRQSDCPGGTVHWTNWRTLYFGCGSTCDPSPWEKACETNSCTGTITMGPYNRGQKKKCGC